MSPHCPGAPAFWLAYGQETAELCSAFPEKPLAVALIWLVPPNLDSSNLDRFDIGALGTIIKL